jgi:hypothetical protein
LECHGRSSTEANTFGVCKIIIICGGVILPDSLRDYCHNEEKNVKNFVAWVEHKSFYIFGTSGVGVVNLEH